MLAHVHVHYYATCIHVQYLTCTIARMCEACPWMLCMLHEQLICSHSSTELRNTSSMAHLFDQVREARQQYLMNYGLTTLPYTCTCTCTCTVWVIKKLKFCLRCTKRNIPFHLRFVCVLTPFCENETLNFGVFVPSKRNTSVLQFPCLRAV